MYQIAEDQLLYPSGKIKLCLSIHLVITQQTLNVDSMLKYVEITPRRQSI